MGCAIASIYEYCFSRLPLADYDRFGAVLGILVLAVGDCLLFAGREYDPLLEMYHTRARIYDTQMRRFVNEARIRFSG